MTTLLIVFGVLAVCIFFLMLMNGSFGSITGAALSDFDFGDFGD